MGMRIYGRIIRRLWWLVLLIFVVSIITGIAITKSEPRIYSSYTMLAVAPNSKVKDVGEIIRSIDSLDRRSILATFARIPTTRETYKSALNRLSNPGDYQHGFSVSASVLPNTNIIRINVEGPDPEKSAELANAIAKVTQREARSMYRIYKMDTITRATPRSKPIHPEPTRNLFISVILGLFFGLAIAFIVEYFTAPAPSGSSISGSGR